jgi:dihydroorotase (multifunctional complex type)
MTSLCVHNAKVVTSRITSGGVLIEDGQIAACLRGSDRASADIVIDARGRLLFPGFVDAHVHMRDPGQPQKEDFGSGSIAAAAGGITTVVCMPNTRPPLDSLSGFDQVRKAGESRSFVDFALQAAVHPSNHAAMGLTMLADGPADEAYINAALLVDMLAQAGALGARVGVYAGNQAVIDATLDRLRKAGRMDFPAFAESRPEISETLGLALLIEARRATGAPIIIRQVSTARGFEIVAAAKAQSSGSIRVEVTPHHLHLDATALARLGAYAQMLPPLRSEADVVAAREAVASGVVDFVGSDHAPHAPSEKDTADPWSCPNGTPGLDTLAAAVLDLAASGIIAYTQVAVILAERPAEAFGIGDRKGRIAVGLDADLVIVDAEAPLRVTPNVVRSRAGRSPFEGMTLRGRPVLTVLRGEVIAEDGNIATDRPRGRFLRRTQTS